MRGPLLLACFALAGCVDQPPATPPYAPITAEEIAAPAPGLTAAREEVVFHPSAAPEAPGPPALSERAETLKAEHDRECAAQRAREAEEAGAGDAAYTDTMNARDAHVAWVHDHCSAHQPPPVVTCNPVCVARRACFVWTCADHSDWAEEVSIYDCDGHRNARATSIHLPCD